MTLNKMDPRTAGSNFVTRKKEREKEYGAILNSPSV